MKVHAALLALFASVPCLADPPPDPATAEATLEKLQADADKAKWDAKTAELNYKTASTPSSGLSNTVTPGTGAGTIEGNVLSAQSMGPLARAVLREAKTTIGTAAITLVLFPGSDSASFVHAEWLIRRIALLQKQLEDANKNADDYDKEFWIALGRAQPPQKFMLAAGIGTALKAASSLASFFASDYSVSGSTISFSDTDGMFAAALAREATRCEGGFSRHCRRSDRAARRCADTKNHPERLRRHFIYRLVRTRKDGPLERIGPTLRQARFA